jgi:methylated-DNA-[protein]-cysteine S-methyltransferase
MLYYVTFQTPLGWIGALSSEAGLLKTTFPQISRNLAVNLIVDNTGTATFSIALFKETIEFYTGYFSRQKITFKGNFDFSGASIFQKIVWETTFQIPFGETRSYSWIAGQIHNPLSCRAVGNALNHNPLPIIVPCHRVINSDGRLGGFGGGLHMKKFLLDLEKESLNSD